MLKDIIEHEPVEEVSYGLRFFSSPSGGCEFPCDENGNVHDLNPAAQINYEHCLAHPEKYEYDYGRVVRYERTWREPRTAVCECGEQFSLINEYLGACECPKCHRWYNLFGQELNDPSTWADGEDW